MSVFSDARSGRRISAVILGAIGGPGVGHVHLGKWRRGAPWAAATPVVLAGVAFNAQALGRLVGYDYIVPLLIGVPIALWLSAIFDLFLIQASSYRPTRWVTTALAASLSVSGIVLVYKAIDRFVLEPFNVPSTSMMPTLIVGDQVMVDKRRTAFPKRGDVVVFQDPEEPNVDVVKRVIGLPGDTITFRAHQVVINGIAVPQCSLGQASWTDDNPHTGEVYLEWLEGKTYLVQYDADDERLATQRGIRQKPAYTVKEGELFVMGDNRTNSYDSRFWFSGRGGGVPFALVKGRGIFRWINRYSGTARQGRVGTNLDDPRLPQEMQELQSDLAACLDRGPRGDARGRLP